MQKTMGHVLKSNQVEFEGRVQLGLSLPRTNKTKKTTTTAQTQQVRIVESNPEYALIEITCCCGVKTCVKCEYATTEGQVK